MKDVYQVHYRKYRSDGSLEQEEDKGEILIPEGATSVRIPIERRHGKPREGWKIDFVWLRKEED